MIMCWECDHPENTHQDYLDHMQGLIDRFGWAVVGLESRGQESRFTWKVTP
jgi:hypothetical protein